MVSSKQVVAPPPPAPVSYFRGNEFDIGAFATYVTGTNGGGTVTRRTFVDDETVTLSSSGSPHGWGGGMDFTYFLPWKYAGFRFQGSGLDLSTQTITRHHQHRFEREVRFRQCGGWCGLGRFYPETAVG